MLNKIFRMINPILKNAIDGRMKFYNYEYLINIIRKNIIDLPKDFDCVVGIPRSGILPASIISNMMGIGYATFENIKDGFYYFKGRKVYFDEVKMILVDDSIATGYTKDVYEHYINTNLKISKIFLYCIFAHKGLNQNVDLIGHITKEKNSLYEWNFLHKRFNYSIGYDLDGVLCDENNISGEKNQNRYVNAISNCRPKYIPSNQIDYVVTNRIEHFRDLTEEWLKDHKVKYRYLLMWNTEFKNRKNPLLNKIDVIRKTPIGFYVESSDHYAKAIHYELGIPVLSVENMVMYS